MMMMMMMMIIDDDLREFAEHTHVILVSHAGEVGPDVLPVTSVYRANRAKRPKTAKTGRGIGSLAFYHNYTCKIDFFGSQIDSFLYDSFMRKIHFLQQSTKIDIVI